MSVLINLHGSSKSMTKSCFLVQTCLLDVSKINTHSTFLPKLLGKSRCTKYNTPSSVCGVVDVMEHSLTLYLLHRPPGRSVCVLV